MAKQNPIEQEGTYPLPEAQVDRFLLKLVIGYPSKAEERAILDAMATSDPDLHVDPIVSIAQLAHARKVVNPPSLGISAFTINHLQDEPRQSVESIGGVPYRVATWTAQASAAMPGHFATRATLPIVARYRDASRRPAADPLAGMLDDDDILRTGRPIHRARRSPIRGPRSSSRRWCLN
jgi:hypothetical protein